MRGKEELEILKTKLDESMDNWDIHLLMGSSSSRDYKDSRINKYLKWVRTDFSWEEDSKRCSEDWKDNALKGKWHRESWKRSKKEALLDEKKFLILITIYAPSKCHIGLDDIYPPCGHLRSWPLLGIHIAIRRSPWWLWIRRSSERR